LDCPIVDKAIHFATEQTAEKGTKKAAFLSVWPEKGSFFDLDGMYTFKSFGPGMVLVQGKR
jgi:hypothetical protein